MRVFAYEFVTGGGLAGRAVPASLAREGGAMLGALLGDLSAAGYNVVTTADPRFPLDVPSSVEVREWPEPDPAGLDELLASADAAWLVAPETGHCLSSLVARAERLGTRVIGCSSRTVSRASDKAALAGRLPSNGIRYPSTRVLSSNAGFAQWQREAGAIGYPVVVKPRRGAGGEGVALVRGPDELPSSVEAGRRAAGRTALVVQEFVPGTPASVSLLCEPQRTMALTLNGQEIDPVTFRYRGGWVPLDHPLAERAIEAARDACQAIGGMRGYVGVDLVLTRSEAVVIEVNPRLTTAYLGLRRAVGANLAEMTIRACDGLLPDDIGPLGRARFTSAGRVFEWSPPLRRGWVSTGSR